MFERFMKTWERVARAMFRRGWLPSRFEHKLDHEFEVRESGFLGLFSYFKGVKPEFAAYMREHGVAFRVKEGTDHNECRCVWIRFFFQRDHDLYVDVHHQKSFYGTRSVAKVLKELDIPFVTISDLRFAIRYRLFSTSHSVMAALRFSESEDPIYRKLYTTEYD